MMSYWAVARLEANRERLALHCLGLAGYQTYFPRLREQRRSRGRRIEVRPALFPGYCFVLIQLQWHAARWAPGTLGLVMNGICPGHVPDKVITEIRARERNGLVELPKRDEFKPGERVRIVAGAFTGQLGLYAGMRPHERVLVLLALLGGQQRVELAKADVEAAVQIGSGGPHEST
jgi:transcriptional antiterminator RfaH